VPDSLLQGHRHHLGQSPSLSDSSCHCMGQLQTEDSHVGKNELQRLLRSLIYEAKELSLLITPQRPSGATSAALTTRSSLDCTAWLAFVNKQTVSRLQMLCQIFAKVFPSKEKKDDKS